MIGLSTTAREWLENGVIAARLARDLPGFLHRRLTPDAARRQVQAHLATREHRFFALLDRTIFPDERSPYRRLLRYAGVERGDVARLVAQEGLEGALQRLAAAGVYVTFDEFKGRREAVRGSARFTFTERDFDPPHAANHYVVYTGGTRGRPSRVGRSLESVRDTMMSFSVVLQAHGIHQPRNLFGIGGSPSWLLGHFLLGHTVDAWYVPVRPLPRLARAGLAYVSALTRLTGQRPPPIEYADLRDAEVIVRWLADHADPARPVLVNTVTSSAVRVADAAARLGVSLAGVTFQCRSEMLSAARRRTIEAAGGHALADYASMELSHIAYGCPQATVPDDVHLCTGDLALAERQRPIFDGGPTVDALLFTTLSEHAPKIALNVETGDVARIEQRACGCLMGDLGLTTHLSEIRSFEKLSSEGTTFARSNVTDILEGLLPARFGGAPLDYQLVEEEGADGVARLVLRVAPGVGPVDEGAVRAALLAGLAQGGMADAYQARLLERAAAVVVVRQPPLATAAGKVLPFHLARGTAPPPSPGG